MANWIFLTAIIAGITVLIIRRRLQPKRSDASLILEEILFPSGNTQKRKVIEAFGKITKQQYTDEEIIDFFLKEKGLQLFSINCELSPEVVKFVNKPTMIDLNYFERVKFHQTFINYPKNFEVRLVENADTVFGELPEKKLASIIAKIA